MNKLIYVTFFDGAAVILFGVTVYHEDDDRDFHQNFSAEEVAERLSKALSLQVVRVELSDVEVPGDYNFDDIQVLALQKVA